MNISRFEEIEVLNLSQRTHAAIRDFINYLKNYVKGTLHWLNNKADFGNEKIKQMAISEAEEAWRYYDAL